MRRFLFDTAVFLYAVGAEHKYQRPCRHLVELASRDQIRGEASVELVQEFVHVRARRSGDRLGATRDAEDVASLCVLHEVTELDLHLALSLFRTNSAIQMRDAIHAATALNRGIDAIVSPDRGFDDIEGLERLDPTEAVAILTVQDG